MRGSDCSPPFVALLRYNSSIAFDDDDQFINQARAADAGWRAFGADPAQDFVNHIALFDRTKSDDARRQGLR